MLTSLMTSVGLLATKSELQAAREAARAAKAAAATLAAHPTPLAYYSAVATVIPVLFLAIIYQARAPESLPRPWGASVALLAFVVVGTGEAEAVNVLRDQHATAGNRHVIEICLTVLFFAVIVYPVNSVIFKTAAQARTERDMHEAGAGHELPRGPRPRLQLFAMIFGPGVLAFVLLYILGHS